MTNTEFIDNLAVAVGLHIWPADMQDRALKIRIPKDEDGMPMSAEISFFKPDSRFVVQMGDPCLDVDERPVSINYQPIQSVAAKAEACDLIERFLRQHSAFPEELRCAA